MLPSRFNRTLLIMLVSVVSGSLSVAQNAPAQAPSRIVLPVDDTVRVTLKGSTHPLAIATNDVGALDGATALPRMILVLRGSPDQEYKARTLIDSQQTKGSPDYHKWLTPEDYGLRFGPSQRDIAQVTAWLQQQGFSVGNVAKSGLWIEFSGASAQVERAFQTQMRQYLVNGELHVANAKNVSIPAALAPVVRGVLSLHDFHSKPMLARSPRKATVSSTKANPNSTFTNGNHGVGPGDFAKIYDLNPLYIVALNGSGKHIAIVAVSNINAATNTTTNSGVDDIADFQNFFGLTVKEPTIVLNGPDPGIDPGDAGAEATLDTEWSGAVAPGAIIDVVVSGGSLTTDPVALGASFIVEQNLSDVMSLSFGLCEAELGGAGSAANIFWNNVFEQAAAQGISAFVSSGDTGAAGCQPNAPSSTAATGGQAISGLASTPFNTAVGGTEFNEGANPATFWNATNDPTTKESALGYIPEIVWNESCSPNQANSECAQSSQFSFASGGGGVSMIYPTPPWQTLNVTGLSTLTNFTLPNSVQHPRGIPDISLTAAVHDPYIFCFTPFGSSPDCTGHTVSIAGGTSFSSPAFAGIMAIVDQSISGTRQGLANYVLYPLAANQTTSPGFSACNSSNRTDPTMGAPAGCVFNDTTAGNNGVPGQTGFNAVTGYDLATGLGSVDANNLVTAWQAQAATFQGTTTNLTASFNGTPLPSGSVTITHGQAISVSVSVARQGATGTPSGDVALIASGGNLLSNVGSDFGHISGSGGTATVGPVNVNNLPGGTSYNLQANYPGDGTFAGSLSNAISLTINPENTTTTLQPFIFNTNTGAITSGAMSVAYGDKRNILVIDADVAGVSLQVPSSGSVTFNISGTPSPVIPVDNSGIAELADCFSPLTSCLAPGTYTVNAQYGGDTNFPIPPRSYNPSPTSAGITITVTKGNPTPQVIAPSTAGAGVAFTLQAVIGTGLGTITPTGTVQFMDGTTALGGPLTLSGGQASMQETFNAAGVHNITVQYSGDSTYNGATSAATAVNVTAPFNFASASTSQTIAAGGTAMFNVTLNGVGGFTGQVSFNCTGAPGGSTCSVSPNPAMLSVGATSVPLVVSVSNTANAKLGPHPFHSLPFVFAGFLASGVFCLCRKPRRRLLLLLGIFLLTLVTSCGGGGGGPRPPTVATLTVTGTSGSVSNTITLNLTVTH